MNYVLDSWALLCLLRGEPGAEKVQKLIDLGRTEKAQLWVSWVNVAEVYCMTFRKSTENNPRIAALRALNSVTRLPVVIVPAGEQESIHVGILKSLYPIGIADAYAAATAKLQKATVVTGDADFKVLEEKKEVEILWLKPKQ